MHTIKNAFSSTIFFAITTTHTKNNNNNRGFDIDRLTNTNKFLIYPSRNKTNHYTNKPLVGTESYFSNIPLSFCVPMANGSRSCSRRERASRGVLASDPSRTTETPNHTIIILDNR